MLYSFITTLEINRFLNQLLHVAFVKSDSNVIKIACILQFICFSHTNLIIFNLQKNSLILFRKFISHFNDNIYDSL